MPVKLARLGLGESPWEHVRNHAFEWGYEGKARGQRHEKAGHKKTGHRSPSQYNQPEGGTPPSHQ